MKLMPNMQMQLINQSNPGLVRKYSGDRIFFSGKNNKQPNIRGNYVKQILSYANYTLSSQFPHVIIIWMCFVKYTSCFC